MINHRYISNLQKYAILVTYALITTFTGTTLYAQSASDPVAQATEDLEQARSQQAGLLSPKSFAKANQEYNRYLQLLREGKPDAEVQPVLARFREAINTTMDHILQGHTILGGLIALRNEAHEVNAPSIVPKEYEEAERRFKKAIEKLEEDKLAEAEKNSIEAEIFFRAAIITATKLGTLGPAQTTLAEVRDQDGLVYVPRTYQKAQSLISEVSSALDRGESLTPELIAKAKRAEQEAGHAKFLLDAIHQMRDDKSNWEHIMLEEEAILTKVGDFTGRDYQYDQDTDELFIITQQEFISIQDSLKSVIEQREDSLVLLTEKIDSLQVAITQQQIRLASTLEQYQTDLQSRKEDLEKRRRELNVDLQKQTILDAANQAQTRFDRKEALVFRENNIIKIRLLGLVFDSGKTAVPKKAIPLLDKMEAFLALYPDTKILIEGHTDATGKEEKNLTYSEARATSVRDYILSSGNIEESSITAKGLGSSVPVASNKTRTGRAQNRRIVVIIEFDSNEMSSR